MASLVKLRRFTDFAAATSSLMPVGIMLPMRNVGSARLASGSAARAVAHAKIGGAVRDADAKAEAAAGDLEPGWPEPVARSAGAPIQAGHCAIVKKISCLDGRNDRRLLSNRGEIGDDFLYGKAAIPADQAAPGWTKGGMTVCGQPSPSPFQMVFRRYLELAILNSFQPFTSPNRRCRRVQRDLKHAMLCDWGDGEGAAGGIFQDQAVSAVAA